MISSDSELICSQFHWLYGTAVGQLAEYLAKYIIRWNNVTSYTRIILADRIALFSIKQYPSFGEQATGHIAAGSYWHEM